MRLCLRRLSLADVDNLVALNSDPAVVRYSGNPNQVPDSLVMRSSELPSYLAYYDKYEHYGIWAVIEKGSGNFVGTYFLRPILEAAYFDANLVKRDDVELGYRLCKAVWGQGYATELSKAVINYGFKHTDMPRVGAAVITENLASIRVLQKAGLKQFSQFFHEGLEVDIALFALTRAEYEATQNT